MKLPRLILRILPIVIIILVWAVIVLTNITPGTFLTGWDNLHPEFNFALNIKRSLFAVWQEYQGLGLLGGMGHAAALPREIILWVFSLILPISLLRYAWTFSMLLLGPLGVYSLIQSIQRQHAASDKQTVAALNLSIDPWVALTGGLFYLLNLGTVQTFFLPFESFVTHYGFLPWLLWSVERILTNGAPKKNLIVFFCLTIISATQWYIPTLFVVYGITIAILCITMWWQQKTLAIVKRTGLILIATMILNAYWLLPFAYFTITKSGVNVGAKINQMATEEVYLRNKAFGTPNDTLTLRNFWFDTMEYDPKASGTVPIMDVWRTHTAKPGIMGLTVLIASLVVGGFIVNVVKRETRVWAIVGFVSFAMIAIDTPPFDQVMTFLRGHVPLLSQFFRFPFTKWSILLMVSYSVFISAFVRMVASLLTRTRANRVIPLMITLISVAILMLPMLPAFTGELISPRMHQEIPMDYTDLFAYLKTQPLGRIANLPQPTYWGWTYYRWGYTGSGFPWYGIEQPILDRAFDVWSAEGEQYYWELSRALYSKNPTAVDALLTKYDIRYILLDENIVSPSSDRGLFLEETKELLNQMYNVNKIAHFENLTLYEKTGIQSAAFISLKTDLPTVSPPYRWTDNDVAYGEVGDYITEEKGKRQTENGMRYVYPFRSLFTKRSIDEREFTVEETEASLILKPLADLPSTSSAVIEKFSSLQFSTDTTSVLRAQDVQPCGILQDGTTDAQNLDQFLRFTSRNQRGCLSFSAGNLSHRDGYLVTVESRHITGRPMLFSLINQTAKHVELETYLERKTANGKRQTEDWQTDYFVLPPLASDGLGYTVYLSNDAIGRQETINDIRSIKFYRIPYAELVTLRSGLSLPIFNKTQPQGTFDQLSVNPPLPDRQAGLSVDHPNPAYYKVSFQLSAISDQPENTTLILSQSFDTGWKAYKIKSCQLSAVSCQLKNKLQELLPFLFGTEIKDRVLVNNWANGWRLPSNESTIILFFLPQLLEWIGFLLLPIPFLWVLLKRNR